VRAGQRAVRQVTAGSKRAIAQKRPPCQRMEAGRYLREYTELCVKVPLVAFRLRGERIMVHITLKYPTPE
jgi:hypothetical protein